MEKIIFTEKLIDAQRENDVLNKIFKLFVQRFETADDAVKQIQYCKENYANEPDYNLAQSALIFQSDPEIRELYASCGYYDIDRYTSWTINLRFYNHVANVADFIIKNKATIKQAWNQ